MEWVNVTEPGNEKMCLMSYANNKGADQPVFNISRFYSRNSKTFASVAVQTGLCLPWSETSEDTFCRVVVQLYAKRGTVHMEWTDNL